MKMDDEQEPNELHDLRDVQPTSFRQIIGQEHVKKALEVAVEASFAEHKRLDDILFCGPPGLGKTGLVTVLQNELGLPSMRTVLAQSITNTAELNSVLLSATEGLLLLDEIALLSHSTQHSLLKVLDDRKIDINTGKTVTSIPVAPFTLCGATTDPDGLIGPLLDRFRIVLHLDYYSHDELAQIVRQRLVAMGWEYEPELLHEIARRARQTPRIAIRLLQSARRWQAAEGGNVLAVDHLRRACEVERISDLGLDNVQQKYLHLLGSGPQRIGVLASLLGMAPKVLQKTVEPYLQRNGMVVKTDAGLRTLTETGLKHLESLRPASVRNSSS
jgi:Holliday junction DNA helicase RuvB